MAMKIRVSWFVVLCLVMLQLFLVHLRVFLLSQDPSLQQHHLMTSKERRDQMDQEERNRPFPGFFYKDSTSTSEALEQYHFNVAGYREGCLCRARTDKGLTGIFPRCKKIYEILGMTTVKEGRSTGTGTGTGTDTRTVVVGEDDSFFLLSADTECRKERLPIPYKCDDRLDRRTTPLPTGMAALSARADQYNCHDWRLVHKAAKLAASDRPTGVTPATRNSK